MTDKTEPFALILPSDASKLIQRIQPVVGR